MKRFNFLLMFFISVFCLMLNQVYAGQYMGLVIGVDKYSDSILKGPGTAVNDANAVASVLKEKFGFKITLLTGEKAKKKK